LLLFVWVIACARPGSGSESVYGTAEVIVGFANRGVAGVPGVLRVTLESPDGKVFVERLARCRASQRRKSTSGLIHPPTRDGRPNAGARGQIEGKAGVRRAIRWACAQPLNPDGSLTIRLKSNSDKDWRKGV